MNLLTAEPADMIAQHQHIRINRAFDVQRGTPFLRNRAI